MKSNSGFYIGRIKQVNTRLLNKFLAKKNITAFNGEQGRILHVLWENDGISNRELSKKSGLAMSSLLINNPKDEFVREFISLEQNKNAENEIAKKIIEKLKENGEYEKMILEIKKI